MQELFSALTGVIVLSGQRSYQLVVSIHIAHCHATLVHDSLKLFFLLFNHFSKEIHAVSLDVFCELSSCLSFASAVALKGVNFLRKHPNSNWIISLWDLKQFWRILMFGLYSFLEQPHQFFDLTLAIEILIPLSIQVFKKWIKCSFLITKRRRCIIPLQYFVHIYAQI